MKLFSTARVIRCALDCALLVSAASVSAAPLHKSKHRHAVVHSHRVTSKVVVVRPAPIRTVTTVSVFSLNNLPVGHVRCIHDEAPYYSDGAY